MASTVKRHPVLLFAILVILFSWPVYFSEVAQARGLLAFHIPEAFGFIGLSLAAVLAAALTGGRAALVDLVSRWVRWRANPAWYLVALFLMAALSAAAIGMFSAFGGTYQVGVYLSLQDLLPFFVFHFFLFLFTEETAWRGFALPRLQRDRSALSASLAIGLFWGVWHTPLFLIPGSFQAGVPYAGFVLSAMATSVLATWIFNHTSGSVLIAALFHSATDAAITYFNVMTGDVVLFWLFVAAQWAVALLVVAVEGAAYLSRDRMPAGATFGQPAAILSASHGASR